MANTIHYPFGHMDTQNLTIDETATPNEVVFEVKNNKTFLLIEETDDDYTLEITASDRLDAGAELSIFVQAEGGQTIDITTAGDLLDETINLDDGKTAYYSYVYTGEEFVPVSDKSGISNTTTTTTTPGGD